MLGSMRLEPTTKQRLQLLLQRQHIEEEELRLRHFMELEKFREREYTYNKWISDSWSLVPRLWLTKAWFLFCFVSVP